MVAHLPDSKFKQLVSSKNLKNFPISDSDITNAKAMFGPNCNRLWGASTRQKPDRVEEEFILIPLDFYRLHKIVTLTADIMFVNGITFMVTFSRNIRLITA